MTSNLTTSGLNLSAKNRFIAVIPVTDVDVNKNIDNFQLNVLSFTTPQFGVKSTDFQYMGQSVPIATNQQQNFNEFYLTFAVSSDYSQYMFIYNWYKKLLQNNAQAAISSGASRNLKPHITVFALSEFLKPIVKFTFSNCYVDVVGSLEYNYDSTDPFNCQATFKFIDMTVDSVSDDEVVF